MRHTEFWARMDAALGPAYARPGPGSRSSAGLDEMTVQQALEAGWDAKTIWRVVWQALSCRRATADLREGGCPVERAGMSGRAGGNGLERVEIPVADVSRTQASGRCPACRRWIRTHVRDTFIPKLASLDAYSTAARATGLCRRSRLASCHDSEDTGFASPSHVMDGAMVAADRSKALDNALAQIERLTARARSCDWATRVVRRSR